MEIPEIHRMILLFFAVAGVVIPIFSRMKISPVLGFLIIGAILGSHGLGAFERSFPILKWLTFHESENNEAIAEFGIVFLMFTIGLELSWERLYALRHYVFGAGVLQMGLCAVVLGSLSYMVFGKVESAAAIVGLALAVSSTAIALPLLAEQKRLAAPEGRMSFSILLFQDLSVAPILFSVVLISSPSSENLLASFGVVFVQAVIAIGIIVIAGRWPLRFLFRLVATLRSDDLFMALCFFVVVATSLITAVFGLSMALGAFLGGLLLAETEYRRAIDAVIEPFKGLLLGLFFMTVGMKVNIISILDNPLLIFGSAFVLYLVKGSIIAAISVFLGLTVRSGIKTGIILGSGSEFSFVIIGLAGSHIISEATMQDLNLISAISMMMLPFFGKVLRFFDVKEKDGSIAVGEEIEEALPDYGGERVIVVGYGAVGQVVSEMLTHHNIPHLIVDTDLARVEKGRRKGDNIYFGDATKHALLEACGIDHVSALVVTTRASGLTETVITIVRRMHPNLTILARAKDLEYATHLYTLGVNNVIPEITETSLQLSEAVLADLGVPQGVIIASIHQKRDDFRAHLRTLLDEDENYFPLPGKTEEST